MLIKYELFYALYNILKITRYMPVLCNFGN